MVPRFGDEGGVPVRLAYDRPCIKALPAMEGGQRMLYLQASTEVRDLQGEKVLTAALVESIPYFLRYGRIDLDHASVLGEIRGHRVNPYAYEIGKPLDARMDGDSVWVKAAIFASTDKTSTGNSWTEAADLFWDSLHTSPPVTWYPSVAGDVYSEESAVENGKPTQVIRRMRWHSIGLSRTPVNQKVQAVTTMPVRVFAKAFGDGTDLMQTLRDLSPSSDFRPGVVRPGDDHDVVAVLQMLAENHQPDVGLTEFIQLAGNRGVAPQKALATLLALVTP